jgi:hypothetical protein
VESVTKLDFTPKEAEYWSELMLQRNNIKSSLYYSFLTLTKAKDEILNKLSELDSATFELLIKKIDNKLLQSLIYKIEDNRHNSLLESFNIFKSPAMYQCK